MISNPFFLLSLLIGSFFAFFTTAFLVEFSIKIFRIKSYRIRSNLRLLPFISLVVDLVFSQYSIAYWVNPLSCSSCIQKLFLEVFFPQLKSHLIENQMSLVHYLGCGHRHTIFSIIFILFGLISFSLIIKKFAQSFFLMYKLRAIAKKSSIYTHPNATSILIRKLQKNKVSIHVSKEMQIPLAVYPNIIILPQKTIDDLSWQELEAVLAHEWEHIKRQDPLSRLLCHLVAIFFWWVPTHSWIKKMEQEQEMACDRSVLKYGIKGDLIASSLCKVAKQIKSSQPLCYFNEQGNSTLLRIQDILGFGSSDQITLVGLNFFGVVFGGVLLLICLMYL